MVEGKVRIIWIGKMATVADGIRISETYSPGYYESWYGLGFLRLVCRLDFQERITIDFRRMPQMDASAPKINRLHNVCRK